MSSHARQNVIRRPDPSQTGCKGFQTGFTLVEVLVAIVILSIGVLGAVGMQAAALQSNKEVRYQALAGSLARELSEKMRGNHVVAVTTTVTTNPYLLDTTSTNPLTKPTPFCATAACHTALDIANWDVYEWQQRVREALPSPRIVVCMDSAPYDASGIPKWDCSNTGTVAVLKLAWNRVDERGKMQLASALTSSPPLYVLPLTAGSTE